MKDQESSVSMNILISLLDVQVWGAGMAGIFAPISILSRFSNSDKGYKILRVESHCP